MMRNWTGLLLILGLGCMVNQAQARTKLTTLPAREEVRIDLSSSQQGLSEEDRTINLVAGLNQVDFSWAGTQISMDSIQIRALKSPGTVRILSVSYPPNENALVWQVWSEKSGAAKFRISYLIYGFTKKTEYMAIASKDETMLNIECRVNLGNMSGESFNRCTVQLGKTLKYKNREMLNGQVRKMLAFSGQNIPLHKTYIYNAYNGSDVRFYYTFKNDPAGQKKGYGSELMQDGKTRVYIQNSSGTETFVGEDYLSPVPVKQDAKIYLGIAKDIKVEANVMKRKTEHIIHNQWYHVHIEKKWTLENFKKENVTLTIEEPLDGQEWEFEGFFLKEETGERDDKVEKEIAKTPITYTRKHNSLFQFEVNLPPTAQTGGKKIKWNLYAKWTLKNRGF